MVLLPSIKISCFRDEDLKIGNGKRDNDKLVESSKLLLFFQISKSGVLSRATNRPEKKMTKSANWNVPCFNFGLFWKINISLVNWEKISIFRKIEIASRECRVFLIISLSWPQSWLVLYIASFVIFQSVQNTIRVRSVFLNRLAHIYRASWGIDF